MVQRRQRPPALTQQGLSDPSWGPWYEFSMADADPFSASNFRFQFVWVHCALGTKRVFHNVDTKYTSTVRQGRRNAIHTICTHIQWILPRHISNIHILWILLRYIHMYTYNVHV